MRVPWGICERALKTDTEEKKLLNKVVVFVSFAHKNYSCSYIKLRLNHWCHMDYFCLYRVRKLLDFIKNILIWVQKMNEGFTVLERNKGE